MDHVSMWLTYSGCFAVLLCLKSTSANSTLKYVWVVCSHNDGSSGDFLFGIQIL